jgi:hypothetical protein
MRRKGEDFRVHLQNQKLRRDETIISYDLLGLNGCDAVDFMRDIQAIHRLWRPLRRQKGHIACGL